MTTDERPANRSLPFALVLFACAVANVLPLFAGRFLPFSDLPEHVAAIAAFGQWSDPSFRIDEHYVFALGESQYLLYHGVGSLLARLVGSPERANLVLLAATGIAWPYSARAFLRSLGRDERLALFACPLFWNHALVVGLLPFVASVPLVLFALAASVRATGRRTWLVAPLAVLLFFAHVQAFAVYAIALVAMTLADRDHRKQLVPRVVALAPSMLVAAGWVVSARIATRNTSLEAPGQLKFASANQLLRGLPFWAHDVWRGRIDDVLGIAFWVFVIVIAMRGATKRLALWMPLAAIVLLFLATPYRVGGGDMLNVRLAVFVPLFVLPLLEPARDRLWPIAAGIALTVLGAANHVHEIRAAQAEIGDFDRVLAALPRGARVLSLQFDRESSHTHFPPWVHLAALHRARNGGVAEPSFAVLGHWPMHYREGFAPPKKDVDFWEFDPCRFRNSIDGPYYDYVLVRGDVDPFRFSTPGPRWRAVVREGEWTLFGREDVPSANEDALDVGLDPGPCAM